MNATRLKEEFLPSRLANVLGISTTLSYPSIIEAIEADHEELRKCLPILKGEDADLAEKKKAFRRFSALLKAHSAAEEKVVYAFCLGINELKEETYEGYVEHGLAGTLMRKISRLRDPARWSAHVKVLAELVEHHMEEEEREFLASLKRCVEAEEQRRLRRDFLNERQRRARRIPALVA